MPHWWPLLLGWPAFLVAILLSLAGIIRRKPIYLAVATLFATPMGLYLAVTPRFAWIGLIFPISLAVAGVAVRKQRIKLAWALVTLFTGLASLLALAVFGE